MNLLFIHGNFPGQFLHLAPFLANCVAKRTVFLTESDNPQGLYLKGVELVRFQTHRQPTQDIHPYLQPSEQCVLRGQAILRAVEQLCRKGFKPDVAVVHGGMGYGLYLKTLLPKLRLISYMEWFFRPEISRCLYANFNLNDSLTTQTRNWPIIQELLEADDSVTPMNWQRQQFPHPWREQIRVIFDGVDTTTFRPLATRSRDLLELKSGTNTTRIRIPAKAPLLTYATRGMEPLRGFAEFMRAAAFAQQKLPDLHIVVAGNDRVAYSYGTQHPSGSWKQQLLEELKSQLDPAKLHFPGLVNYSELICLFQRSDLHCYFTRPYIISWGLFQAAACGSSLLVNRFPGIEEVFYDPARVRISDLDNQEELNNQTVCGLKANSIEPPASNLRPGLDLVSALRAWKHLLVNG